MAAALPPRLFGTDGIRGRADILVTPALGHRLGRALAGSLPPGARVVVAADTRPSSPGLSAAVAAGLVAGGVHVLALGVAPTAAVAHVAAAGLADAGVMISASHNPAADNGLKVFGAGGFKLDDDAEIALERLMASGAAAPAGSADPSYPGRVTDRTDLLDGYSRDLLGGLRHRLDGLRVVVDCANGAAGGIAPRLYEAAGATVFPLATGEGTINDGVGATHLDAVRSEVLRRRADIGIAHDGDADRCLAVAADGSDVDGDAILAILAIARQAPAVVTTVMANLGFHRAMAGRGIGVVTTAVGDRYVLEVMRERGIALGGEQSGHVVLLDQATTGDGLRTALQLLACVAGSGRAVAELAGVVQRLPQVLRGVVAPRDVLQAAAVGAAIQAETDALGGDGRVLVRASGTEPLVRVMVEAMSPDVAEAVCGRLCEVVTTAAQNHTVGL